MQTDSIGGRKFIGFILSMLGWGAILYVTVMSGEFKGDSPQSFMFFLIAIQTLFFGGNVLEKLIQSKTTENKTEEVKK